MSHENVEIVRRHGRVQSGTTRPRSRLITRTPLRRHGAPRGRTYRGRDGVVEATRVWAGSWDDWKWEIEELIDAGDAVLMVVRESGREGSRVEVVQQTFWVYRLRGGQMCTQPSWWTGPRHSKPWAGQVGDGEERAPFSSHRCLNTFASWTRGRSV